MLGAGWQAQAQAWHLTTPIENESINNNKIIHVIRTVQNNPAGATGTSRYVELVGVRLLSSRPRPRPRSE